MTDEPDDDDGYNDDGLDSRGLLRDEKELWRNDQWRVTNMFLQQINEDGTAGHYWIGREAIGRQNWIEHMSKKAWVGIESFKEAYSKARELWEKE
jgi:hypothetical protein